MASPYLESLPFNYFQSKGTHNSYHLKSNFSVTGLFDYEHKSLLTQLEHYGIRQLEFDINIDDRGRLKVNHIPFIDDNSHCTFLRNCLEIVKRWSKKNPRHFPIVIWIEPKINFVHFFHFGYKEFELKHFLETEKLIGETFQENNLFIPDMLRGDSENLAIALAKSGWPSLKEMRGKIIFVLLNTGELKRKYIGNNKNLKGKKFFVQSKDPSSINAVFFKEHSLEDFKDYKLLLKKNYILTVMSDSKKKSFKQNRLRIMRNISNGIHFLSSDIITDSQKHLNLYFQGENILNNKVIELNQ